MCKIVRTFIIWIRIIQRMRNVILYLYTTKKKKRKKKKEKRKIDKTRNKRRPMRSACAFQCFQIAFFFFYQMVINYALGPHPRVPYYSRLIRFNRAMRKDFE